MRPKIMFRISSNFEFFPEIPTSPVLNSIQSFLNRNIQISMSRTLENQVYLQQGSRFNKNIDLPQVQVVPDIYQPHQKSQTKKPLNYFAQNKPHQMHQKYIIIILGMLLAAATFGSIYYFRNCLKKQSVKDVVEPILVKGVFSKEGGMRCEGQSVQHNGKCVVCRKGWVWSGSFCKMQDSGQYHPRELRNYIHRIYERQTALGVEKVLSVGGGGRQGSS